MLIPDLQNIVCQFAWDATLEETLCSLEYLLFVNDLNLHPYCLADGAEDHTNASPYLYDREKRHSCVRFSWGTRCQDTPLKTFFVWFSKHHIIAHSRIHQLLFDLDWRTVRHRFHEVGCRSRESLVEYLCSGLHGVILVSQLFDEISLRHLKLHPSGLSRQMINNRAIHPL